MTRFIFCSLYAFLILVVFVSFINAQEVISVDDFKALESVKPIIIDTGYYLKTPQINIKVGAREFHIDDEKRGLLLDIRAPFKEFVFLEVGSKAQMKTRFVMRIKSKKGEIDGVFEEILVSEIDMNQLNRFQTKTFVVRKVLDLPTGIYESELYFSDMLSGAAESRKFKFRIR